MAELFGSACFATSGEYGVPPIFIVGMPRSGSTLVEQIIASHPDVQGMGEMDVLAPICGALDPIGDVGDAASAYLDAVKRQGWRGEGCFTDKSLSNFQFVGLIHRMFPTAPIIHTLREPADTCLSCFRTLFTPDGWTRFAYDLGDLGRYYRAYRGLMDHWTFTAMGRVTTLHYERLISDPEGEVRRLLDACRLPWDAACLRFYDNPRDVRTASAEQVRRPIFGDSIGRWRNYRAHLAPLFAALGPYAPRKR